MKKTAKILAILLATFLGITAMLPLFAHAAPDQGTLTIHKYLMDDLRDALPGNLGEPLPDPTVLDDVGAIPVEGVVFKVYQIVLPGPTTPDGDNVSKPHPYPAPPHSHTHPGNLVKGLGKGAVTLNDYANPTQIILNTPVVNPAGGSPISTFDLVPAPAAVVTTGADGSVTTDPLDKGFYLVVEQPAANPTLASHEIASMSFPFIVAVPMTNATGDGWIENVHVYPKNGDISIDKKVNVDAVFVGETVTWTIDISVPADIMHYEQFLLTDTLDDALTYVPGSLKVYALADKADDELTDGQLIPMNNSPAMPAKTYYALTEPAVGNDFQLKVEFIVGNFTTSTPTYTVDGRNWLFGDFDGVNGIEPAQGEFGVKFVRFVFDTIVNEKILDRLAEHASYTIGNDAEANFKHRYDTVLRLRETEITTEIHTAAVILNKVNAHNDAELPGAEFQIASSADNAKNGIFLKRVIVGGEILAILDEGETFTTYNADGTVNTVYTYEDDAVVWFETSKLHDDIQAASLVPPVTGILDYNFTGYPSTLFDLQIKDKAIVRFEGLKEFTGKADDADPGYLSYWIVETKAPTDASGQTFNLLLEPIRVTFGGTGGPTRTSWYTLDGGIVRNTNTFTLPRTGGIGTILFTAGGIALIGLAALLFIVSAKKKKQKAQG